MSTAPSTSSESGAPHRPARSRRVVWWGGLGLIGLTWGGMVLALLWPDSTLIHFWLIAQLVPVLYWLLAWALLGAHTRGKHVD